MLPTTAKFLKEIAVEDPDRNPKKEIAKIDPEIEIGKIEDIEIEVDQNPEKEKVPEDAIEVEVEIDLDPEKENVETAVGIIENVQKKKISSHHSKKIRENQTFGQFKARLKSLPVFRKHKLVSELLVSWRLPTDRHKLTVFKVLEVQIIFLTMTYRETSGKVGHRPIKAKEGFRTETAIISIRVISFRAMNDLEKDISTDSNPKKTSA